MSRKGEIIDIETGEWLGTTTVDDMEDTQRRKKYIAKITSTDKLNVFIAEKYGSFYFLFKEMINKGVGKQFVIRFLYLCTFINYDGAIIYGHAKKEYKYMTEKDFQEVLNLNKRETAKTRHEFMDKGLIFKTKDGHLQVNNQYCLKGNIETNRDKVSKIRVFEKAIRNLYEKTSPREHRKLAILITLLPYINLHNNIICYNPMCEFKFQLRVLNLKDICKIVGYSENQSSRLRKELLDLKVAGEFVIMYGETGKAKFIKVNPRIYYGGTSEDYKDLEDLATDFDIKS